ncbi:MFS transporter [Candidatus Micrarchaeota archaeon]|nr:MFS transporter [Candidatus Micrarchaeota archaeon]
MIMLFEGIKRNVIVLGIVSFLTDVSSEMVFPIIPLFLTTVLGVGTEIVGLVEGVADSISSLLDIFFGYWSDLRGRRKDFVVAGYGLSAILKAGLVLATIWQQILLIRGLERVGKSIRTSPRDAIIAESADEKSRGAAFGLHRAKDTMGAVVGPLLALAILSLYGQGESGYRTVFMFGLVPAALAVFTILLFVREPKKTPQKEAVKKPHFWESLRMLGQGYKRFLMISCLFSLAYFSFALLIVRASNIGIATQDILLIYVLYNVVYAIASMPIGTLSDRIGRKHVIAASFMLYALICVGFIFVSDFWQVAALFAIYGIFVAADESVNKAYISDMVEEKSRGIALGAYNSAVGAVYLPANAIFGAIWAGLGATVAFGAAAAVAVGAGILMATQK